MSILTAQHFHELVKVQSAGAVLIDLLNDAIEILLGEFVVNLTQNLLESVCSDEALLVLVINTESLLQLLLQRLVILLHQELGGKLTKLTKLEKTRSVLVDLLDDLPEGGGLDLHPHHGEDAAHVIRGDGAVLIGEA